MKKILAISLLVVMVVMVMLSILPTKVVVGVLALIGFAALFGAACIMSLKSWIEIEKKDPEKARKMWYEAMIQMEQQRQMLSLF